MVDRHKPVTYIAAIKTQHQNLNDDTRYPKIWFNHLSKYQAEIGLHIYEPWQRTGSDPLGHPAPKAKEHHQQSNFLR